MKIKKLVVTTEQSRKFSNLGLFKDSVFVWYHFKTSSKPFVSKKLGSKESREGYIGPAPTVQELTAYLLEWAKESSQQDLSRWTKIRQLEWFGKNAEYLANEIFQIIDENQKNKPS